MQMDGAGGEGVLAAGTYVTVHMVHALKYFELDLQSLFGLHVHSCTHWERPHNPPPPHMGSYTRALLVSQDRRHLFVIPRFQVSSATEDNLKMDLYALATT